MSLDDDYFDINMDGVPRAWYRHVPAAIQKRVMEMDPRLRIVRHVMPPNPHLCICRDKRAIINTAAGSLPGWYSIEDRIRGGLAGVEHFLSFAKKNYREWEANGGDDADKQFAAQERAEAEIEEEKLIVSATKFDEASKDFWSTLETQKVITGPGILPGDSIMGPDGAPRRVRRA